MGVDSYKNVIIMLTLLIQSAFAFSRWASGGNII